LAYIDEPARIPWYLRLALRAAEKKTGRRMLPGRLLAWHPRSALGAGLLEALVTHRDREIPPRLLKLVRVQVSFQASCRFCIDMNAFGFEESGISPGEILALQKPEGPSEGQGFSPRELAALAWVRGLTATPIRVEPEVLAEVKRLFSPRALVILSATASQVNFWTRLIQGLGIPPAGFHESCTVLNLDSYGTLRGGEPNPPRP